MKNVFLVPVLILGIVFYGCSSDDSNSATNDSDGNELITPVPFSNIDQQLLAQIQKVGAIFDTDQIWTGYNLKEMPLYLIHKNDKGMVDKGMIINPQTTINGATAIEVSMNEGVEAYLYNKDIQRAYEVLTNGIEANGLYDFDFEIDGKGYYLQLYSDKEVVAGEEFPSYPGGFFDPDTVTIGAIDFIVHEVFHQYQDTWSSSSKISRKVNRKALKASNELLELVTLAHQIFKDFPNTELDANGLEEKLKQYVAITSKTQEMGYNIFGETIEGTARYIETMVLRAAFPKRDNAPFIPGTVLENDYGISNKEILNLVFKEALYYEIGASVCFILSIIDRASLDDLNKNERIFDVSSRIFNMDAQEIEVQIQNARSSVDWQGIQDKVQEWEQLK